MDGDDIRNELKSPREYSLGDLVMTIVSFEITRDKLESRTSLSPETESMLPVMKQKLRAFYSELSRREEEYKNGQ